MTRFLPVAGVTVTALVVAGLLVQPASAKGQQEHRGGSGTAANAAPPPPPPAPPSRPAPPPPTHAASSPSPQPSSSGHGGSSDSGRAVRRGGERVERLAEPTPTANDPSGHRRGNSPTETAVPRSAVPRPAGGVVVAPVSGFYPWGFAYGGGAVFAGYYDGYYGAYDPWYGWSPVYGPSYSSLSGYDGALRLKVKPAEASVYVDGYYVGIVDDFDGIFQRLRLEAGSHRIEIRAPGYETLTFNVRIDEDKTTTYRGALSRLP